MIKMVANNQKKAGIVKGIICIAVLAMAIYGLIVNWGERYTGYYVQEFLNSPSSGAEQNCSAEEVLEQEFRAESDILNSIKLWVSGVDEGKKGDLVLEILDSKENVIKSRSLPLTDITAESWNKIVVDVDNLKKDAIYKVRLYTSTKEIGISLFTNNASETVDWLKSLETGGNVLKGTLAVGFTYTEKYTEISFFMVLNAVLVLFLSSLLCYVICNFELLIKCYKETERKQGTIWAIFMAVVFVFLYNPLSEHINEVDSFDRVIGQGIIFGIDCSKIINHFTIWFFVFALVLSAYILLMNFLCNKEYSGEQKRAWNTLEDFMAVAFVDLVLNGVVYYMVPSSEKDFFSYSSCFIILFLLFESAYIFFHLDKKISLDAYQQIFYSVMALGFPVAIAIGGKWGAGRLLIAVNVMALTVVIALLCVGKKAGTVWKIQIDMKYISVIFCALPLITSFYIELVNILNQHSIFVGNPRKYYLFGVTVYLGFFLFWMLFRRNNKPAINWKSIVYPELILGYSFLSVQLPLQQTLTADIFESANTSILISDFLNYGKIPIVEHYGGHMLSGVLEGILYAVLNNDYMGAIYSPYVNLILPILALLFFYMLKRSVNVEYAFWIVLLFPFYNYWSYFGLGMLSCLAVMSFVKKKTYTRAFGIWLICVLLVLYRLDLGAAYGIATVSVLALYIIITKECGIVKKLLSTFACVVIVGVSAWFVLCLVKQVNPVERLLEFLLISASNKNWAYRTIGDPGNTIFAWSYLFVPLAMVGCLVYVCFSPKFRQKQYRNQWFILLFLGISYIANFSRGCVRHSIAEMHTGVIMWSAYLFFAIFVMCLFDNKKIFLGVFLGFILFDTLLIQDGNFRQTSIADNANTRIETAVDTWSVDKNAPEGSVTRWVDIKNNKEVVNRIEWTDELEAEIGSIKALFDVLLDEDETYLDFSNKTFMYSALNKENPVYVTQSPGQLSGEYTQEQFVEQIEDRKQQIPLVIMPMENAGGYAVDLDGIANTVRYYKVAEYIYQNYRPLCTVSNVAIWCEKDRYGEFRQQMLAEKDTEIPITAEKENTIVMNAARAEVVRSPKSGQLELQITATGADPFVDDFQNIVETENFVGRNVTLKIRYQSTKEGELQLYIAKKGASYTEGNSIKQEITEAGVAEFDIFVGKDVKLRLDIPEDCILQMECIELSEEVTALDWGYDKAGEETENAADSEREVFHNYAVELLPYIWAAYDKEMPVENKVQSSVSKISDRIFSIDSIESIQKADGNYLLLTVDCPGTDRAGVEGPDDETYSAVVKLGVYEDAFAERYQYQLVLKEGTHDYLIRVSNDYYWYIDEINAIELDSQAELYNVEMKILSGD